MTNPKELRDQLEEFLSKKAAELGADFPRFLRTAIEVGKRRGGVEEVVWHSIEDTCCPPQDWMEEEQQDPWERDDDAVEWVRSRPPKVQEVLLVFPPGCHVRAKSGVRLHCPSPGNVGKLVSYQHNERTDELQLGVLSHPLGRIVYACDPNELEVAGYFRGLTPEVIASYLAERPVGHG